MFVCTCVSISPYIFDADVSTRIQVIELNEHFFMVGLKQEFIITIELNAEFVVTIGAGSCCLLKGSGKVPALKNSWCVVSRQIPVFAIASFHCPVLLSRYLSLWPLYALIGYGCLIDEFRLNCLQNRSMFGTFALRIFGYNSQLTCCLNSTHKIEQHSREFPFTIHYNKCEGHYMKLNKTSMNIRTAIDIWLSLHAVSRKHNTNAKFFNQKNYHTPKATFSCVQIYCMRSLGIKTTRKTIIKQTPSATNTVLHERKSSIDNTKPLCVLA